MYIKIKFRSKWYLCKVWVCYFKITYIMKGRFLWGANGTNWFKIELRRYLIGSAGKTSMTELFVKIVNNLDGFCHCSWAVGCKSPVWCSLAGNFWRNQWENADVENVEPDSWNRISLNKRTWRLFKNWTPGRDTYLKKI